MRVCFYWYSLQKGGAERVISTLANYLIANGDEVIVALCETNNMAYELKEEAIIHNLNLSHDKGSRHTSLYNMLTDIQAIRRVQSIYNPDVIVTFSAKNALVAKAALPKVCVIGSERANPLLERTDMKSIAVIHAARIVDGFIFQTYGAMRCYPRAYLKKGIVLRNPLPGSIPSDLKSVSGRIPRVCVVSRLIPSKRIDLVLEAFSKAAGTNTRYSLIICGDGPERSRLESIATTLDIQKRVSFLGEVGDPYAYMSESQIFITASESEGMPNSLIEAMACGCACISCDCNFGPSDIIEDGINGYLVPVGDVHMLTMRLLYLMGNISQADRIGKAARETSKYYSVDAVGIKFRDYLCEKIRGMN